MKRMNNSAERSEVSLHEVKVFLALRSKPDEWLTSQEISESSGVNYRTTRMHTLRLVKLGMFEVVRLHPAHRYRLAGKEAKRNASYAQRLEKAIGVFDSTTK